MLLFYLFDRQFSPIFFVHQLKEDLIAVANGQRNIVPIPFFTIDESGKKGIMRRQCTADYKIFPINKKMRELLGLEKGEKRKKGTVVEMLMGISLDEVYRVKPNRVKYITNNYPLIDLKMSRKSCMTWMEKNKYPKPPRSACTFCPFHNNEEWRKIKENKEEWEKVIEFDKLIRTGTKTDDEVFLHKDCLPIDQVNLEDKKDNQIDLFNNECEGMCGI